MTVASLFLNKKLKKLLKNVTSVRKALESRSLSATEHIAAFKNDTVNKYYKINDSGLFCNQQLCQTDHG